MSRPRSTSVLCTEPPARESQWFTDAACYRPAAWLIGLAALAAPLFAGAWEPLFNGRDLSGWRLVSGNGPFTVIDGAIVGTTVGGAPGSFLATERTYGNFIFEGEVMQDIGPSNSGVQFRGLSLPGPGGGRVGGYQLEIDPSPRAWTGGITDQARYGWLYPVTFNPRGHSVYQFGRWNHVRIEAIGSSVRTWVNGVAIAHVEDEPTPAGFFALQIHAVRNPEDAGHRTHWRNLRVQTTDLRPSPPDDIFVRNVRLNEISDAERAQGWRLLWDGRTTEGWRGAEAETFPLQGWSLEGGVLSALGTKGGSIVTTEEFGAFELQWEFLLTEGANSGIKYLFKSGPGGPVGLEYQLIDDARDPQAKQGAAGSRTLASLYDLMPREPMPSGAAIVPRLGRWQHARVVAWPDGRVEHWLNGIEVVAFNRKSRLFAALVARSKFAEHEDFGQVERSPILLQDHSGIVRFRNIKIRPL